jgi:tRNA pseudouridine38-40 synthase
VARLSIPFFIEDESLLKAMNSNLPDDIRVLRIESCEDSFNPLRDAKKKEYRYKFTNDRIPNPLTNDYIVNYSFEVDFETMDKACKLFIGHKNFNQFFTQGSVVKTTQRSIYECEILRVSGVDQLYPDHYCLRVVGSGFLKQMVRLIMGTIWNVGRGKVSLQDLEISLAGEGKDKLAAVAPAAGLFLYKVDYK